MISQLFHIVHFPSEYVEIDCKAVQVGITVSEVSITSSVTVHISLL